MYVSLLIDKIKESQNNLYSLFPIPYSLSPIPYPLSPIPYPLFPTPYPLIPNPYLTASNIREK